MRRLPIANPCPENWDSMQAAGNRRFCDKCEKHVHDLSSMTPRQAAELVAAKRSKLCVRFLHDGKDVLHLSPAPADPTRLVHGIAAGLVAGIMASCTPHGSPPVETYDWEEKVTVAAQVRLVQIPDAAGLAEPCQPNANEHPRRSGVLGTPIPPAQPVMGDFPIEEVVGDGL
jgi:hypothetical protein